MREERTTRAIVEKLRALLQRDVDDAGQDGTATAYIQAGIYGADGQLIGSHRLSLYELEMECFYPTKKDEA